MELKSDKLHGVEVVNVSYNQIPQLKGQPTRGHRVIVLELSNENETADAETKKILEATLPLADEYVLWYRSSTDEHIARYEDSDDAEDPEPDSIESLPRLIESQFHLDVPHTYARSLHSALRKAWMRVLSGDRLLIVGSDPNHTNQILHTVSQTTQAGTAKKNDIRTVQQDDDLAPV